MSQKLSKPLDKALDCAVLEKILRLDRKDANFDYKDLLRNLTIKVSYPQTQAEQPAYDTVLMSLWRHLSDIYFKPISIPQIERLRYLSQILQPNHEGIYQLEENQEFQTTLNSVYSESYLKNELHRRYGRHTERELSYIAWQLSQESDTLKQQKLLQAYDRLALKMRRSRCFSEGSSGSVSQRFSAQLFPCDAQQDNIVSLIQNIEMEIEGIKFQVKDFLTELQNGVNAEVELQQIQRSQLEDQRSQSQKFKSKRQEARKQQGGKIELIYLQKTIRELQKKQIAESISKINRFQGTQGNPKIQLLFQPAMGIEARTFSQKEFREMNDLRDSPLLQPKLQSQKFAMCHDCKQIEAESRLVTCKYSSSQPCKIEPSSPYFDSYRHQVLKKQRFSFSTTGYHNREQYRRDSYLHYNKKHSRYVCGRKYCIDCLANYEEGQGEKAGLCPYCRGVCNCTRCTRSDSIIRLKTTYMIYGGDILQLLKNSYFESFYPLTSQTVTSGEKGRGKKDAIRSKSAPGIRMEKMRGRYRIQELVLSDFIKRSHEEKLKKSK